MCSICLFVEFLTLIFYNGPEYYSICNQVDLDSIIVNTILKPVDVNLSDP
jgi:hypothetical protein